MNPSPRSLIALMRRVLRKGPHTDFTAQMDILLTAVLDEMARVDALPDKEREAEIARKD